MLAAISETAMLLSGVLAVRANVCRWHHTRKTSNWIIIRWRGSLPLGRSAPGRRACLLPSLSPIAAFPDPLGKSHAGLLRTLLPQGQLFSAHPQLNLLFQHVGTIMLCGYRRQ